MRKFATVFFVICAVFGVTSVAHASIPDETANIQEEAVMIAETAQFSPAHEMHNYILELKRLRMKLDKIKRRVGANFPSKMRPVDMNAAQKKHYCIWDYAFLVGSDIGQIARALEAVVTYGYDINNYLQKGLESLQGRKYVPLCIQ